MLVDKVNALAPFASVLFETIYSSITILQSDNCVPNTPSPSLISSFAPKGTLTEYLSLFSSRIVRYLSENKLRGKNFSFMNFGFSKLSFLFFPLLFH